MLEYDVNGYTDGFDYKCRSIRLSGIAETDLELSTLRSTQA